MLIRFPTRWLICLFGVAAPASSAFADTPPDELVRRLSSEEFPKREAAERELAGWVSSRSSNDWDWLVDQATNADDPEVRSRVMRVLRQAVLGKLGQERPGFVGVTMSAVRMGGGEGDELGVQVLAVSPGSPADVAGLGPGDVIVSLDGKVWHKEQAQDEFASRVGSMKPGTEITLGVLRNGKKREFRLTLAPRPWSAGDYGDLRNQAFDPFAPGIVYPSEDEAQDKVFRQWMQDHRPGR